MTKHLSVIFPFLFLAGLLLGGNYSSAEAQNVDEQELIDAKNAYIDGLTAFENENFQRALDLLTSAYVKLPDHPGVNFALADAYLRLDDLPNAAYYGKQAARLDPSNKWYHLKLAEIYRRAGKNDATLKEFKTALKYHPKDSDILYELAQTYTNHGKLLMANKIYNRLLHLDGPSISIHLSKLRNFDELNMQDSAVVELKNIRALDPDNLSTMQVLSNYYLEMERVKDAKQILQKALKINQQDPKTLIMLSDIYGSEAKWDSVSLALGKVASDSSVAADDKLKLAEYLITKFRGDSGNTGLKKAVSSVFQDLMQAEPESKEIQGLAADFFVRTQQNTPALKALERTTKLIPTSDTAWRQRLQLLLMEGKTQQAISVGQQAAEAIPQDPVILYFLGSAYLSNQNRERAVEKFEEATTLPVRQNLKASILGSLGDAYAGMERWEQAYQNYEKALDIDPENPIILNNYAYFLALQNKRLQKAEKMARRAITLDPENPSYLDTVGWICYQQGNYEQARDFVREALDTGRASAEVMEHMGDILDKLNQPEEARQWWQKALQKDSSRTHLKSKISS